MKEIVLPKSHPLFNWFPDLESQKISYPKFESLFRDRLKVLAKKSNNFNLQKEIKSEEHVNWRYPLMTPFFIKNDLKNKNVLHIGSRKGEICEGLSRYCKSLTSVELIQTVSNKSLDRKYSCPRKTICDDIFNIKKLDQFDLFYLWIGFELDPKIMDHIYSNTTGKKTIYVGVPQELDKFDVFCSLVKDFVEKTKSKLDYIPIIFDELEDHPPTQHTAFTRVTEWSGVETFSNQSGVMLLLKIDLNKNEKVRTRKF